MKVDSLSIVPFSFSCFLDAQQLDSSKYFVEWATSTVRWDSVYLDTLILHYRVFPVNFSKTFEIRNDSIVQKNGQYKDPFRYVPEKNASDVFSMGSELNRTGSLSRGINFGNNQDLSVNSNLNLQLSGRITDDIQVLASITDDNIPIQPDGNTQQLQDFDRVFIQLFNDRNKLIAGDFQLRNFDPYFMKYFKRARGGTFTTAFDVGQEKLNMEFSAALSKGRFSRNVFFGTEGVQGPYKLRGADNESFVIVLAGTEKIFIDGKLLKRGENYDYVINYNAAEITFTPNQLITKDKRIVVEFQYSDRNYARSLLQQRTMFNKGKWNFDFNFISESDSKNQPLQQTLNADDRELLSAVGDDLISAVIPSIDSLEFNANQVFYALVDSLGYDSVFVFSTQPDSAVYSLAFSDLGQGNGNYISADFSANGRTYQWVAPDTISGEIRAQGRFEPVVLLVSPKKRQMLSLRTSFQQSESSNLSAEVALSNNDINTFSALDREDNIGAAVNLQWDFEKRINKKDSAALFLVSQLNTEYVSEVFEEIERFRPTEFERNWNLFNVPVSGNLQRNKAAFGLKGQKFGQAIYEMNSLHYTGQYDGFKNLLNTNIQHNGWKLILNASHLNTTGIVNSSFLRHKAEFSREIGKIVIGFRDDQESNRQFLNQNRDLLNAMSYAFFDWQAFVGNTDSVNIAYELFYRQRTDDRFDNALLNRAAIAEELGGEISFRISKTQQLSALFKSRDLQINNPEIISDSPENTLLGRIQYNGRLAKGGIVLGTFYEIGSGLEPRREFIYLEVPAGQGTFIWNDYNTDGIRDLDEFEVAQFAYEANFIRAFTPTDEYSRTFTNQFTQTINLKPKAFLKKEKGFYKFLGRLSNQSSFKIDRKTNREERNTIYNPFLREIEDTTLLAFNSIIRNTLSFNRASAIWGIDLIWNDNQTKQLLSNGFDSRSSVFLSTKIRWNFSTGWGLMLENESGNRNSISDFLNNRNYRINYTNLTPSLSYQPNQFLRIKLDMEFSDKQNDTDLGGEVAQSINAGSEFRYSWPGKGSLQANFNLVDIDYNGLDNSAVGFEMLDGLRTGTNLTWSLLLQRNISKNLQMNINYNARKSEENKAIHNGGVQVRAYF